MKFFGICAFVLVLMACNTTDSSKPQQVGTTDKSGIEGTVTIGPSCPVQRVDDPSCDDRPYQAEIHVNTNNGVWVKKFTPDAQGNFKIELEPGQYNIDPQTPKEGFLPRASSQDVTVVAGAFTTLNIQYDSGIR
jgi:hypothetical protein